jgi:5-(carboxyamino)imidazole ribonucleotide mutase
MGQNLRLATVDSTRDQLAIANWQLAMTTGNDSINTRISKTISNKMAKKADSKNPKSLVAVLMGSKSDWDTMRASSETLEKFGVAHECHVMSAHRTPAMASEFAATADSRGIQVIIAAAGGAAHLAGVMAAHTTLPVLGVPMTSALNGLDSLLSTVQMPGGIPVGTLAIGKAGATNAALLAIAILANSRPDLKKKLRAFRAEQEKKIRAITLD